MKFIQSTLVIVALLVAGTSLAQKPKKTFDHTKFAKKVMFSFTPQYVTAYSPNEKALLYISEKSGRPIADVRAENEANKLTLKEDVTYITGNNIMMVIGSVDVIIKSESPVKTADIVVSSSAGKINYTFTNCIQTDITWVLGDHIVASGDDLDGTLQANAEHEEKKEAAQARRDSLEALYGGSNSSIPAEPLVPSYKYVGHKRSMQRTDKSTRYFDFDLIGKPMNGYLIAKDGTKTECVIKQQDPEKLQDPASTLLIYNTPYTDAAYTEDETANFKRAQMKNELRAFFVGGNMYVNDGKQWSILIYEGAIRDIVRLVPTQINGKKVYLVAEIVQKLDGEHMNRANLKLDFINTMTKWVSENPEMVAKIKNKEAGYEWASASSVITEFNKWYEEQFPEKAPYVNKPK